MRAGGNNLDVRGHPDGHVRTSFLTQVARVSLPLFVFPVFYLSVVFFYFKETLPGYLDSYRVSQKRYTKLIKRNLKLITSIINM